MRLLASTDFALRILMRLAMEPQCQLNSDELSRELDISRNHLQKIVQALAEKGFVKTIRGAKGGVTLGQKADHIKLGNVIRCFESDQALVDCFRSDGGSCGLLPGCRLKNVLGRAQHAFMQHIDGYTLADIVRGAK